MQTNRNGDARYDEAGIDTAEIGETCDGPIIAPPSLLDTRLDLFAIPVVDLVVLANFHHVGHWLRDGELVVRRHRYRQDIAEAMIARADEIVQFLIRYRPAPMPTADDMSLAVTGKPFDLVLALLAADLVDELAARYAQQQELVRVPTGMREQRRPPQQRGQRWRR